ncbi:uncharacterized protein LOC126317053 isoform X2 [Schistocerca gregaria]|uniref:uncharacterized protein LOC126317053 isoform X2 n=1 Tax=Schistocerca gregaria TaxID=7010 RepID=UPI00211E154D|nr:uncharacterized protein LOC126317053 isoform X2 [Schistocerca gregaria]
MHINSPGRTICPGSIGMAGFGATAGTIRERHKVGKQLWRQQLWGQSDVQDGDELWGRWNVQDRLDEHRRPAGVRRGAEFRAQGEGYHQQTVVHWPLRERPAGDNDEQDDDHHHCQGAVSHCSN